MCEYYMNVIFNLHSNNICYYIKMFADFGLEILSERVAETNFPWLMSNVIDNETGRPLGDGKITHVLDWNGKRIGLVSILKQYYINGFNLFCLL